MSNAKREKITYFNDHWLRNPDYSLWLKRVDDNTRYGCKVCPLKNSHRTLGDMGEGALTKHAGTEMHTKNLAQYMKTMRFFLPRSSAPVPAATATTTAAAAAAAAEAVVATPPPTADVAASILPAQVVLLTPDDEPGTSGSVNGSPIVVAKEPIPCLMRGQSAKKAQIIWALQCVKQGYSDNSNRHTGDILRAMCPTSLEALDFNMGPSKLKYVINHRLYPHYKELLDKDIQLSSFLTIMFDESLNDVLQKSEMDIHVRYWDESEMLVKVRYYDSRFLGHTTAKDLLNNFNDCLKDVDTSKVLHVSMDGPSTNKLFLEEMQKERRLEQMREVIDIGTCNLHTIHGAFETGVVKSGWNLKNLLKGAYRILHDTAARRDDYY